MLKINKIKIESIFFKDLKPGEIFVTSPGNVYLKISEKLDPFNCVNFHTYEVNCLPPTFFVTPVNAELTISYKSDK